MTFKFFTLFLLGISFAQAMPAQVVMIRHAEKPESGDELNARGELRAKALVSYLSSNPLINQFGPIAGLFAAKPPSSHGSVRSIQTLTPYASVSGLKLNADFDKFELKKLVKKISEDSDYDRKTVLICFDHDSLTRLAEEFGVENGPRWDNDMYDRTWIISFVGGKVEMQDIAQRLLSGDAPRKD